MRDRVPPRQRLRHAVVVAISSCCCSGAITLLAPVAADAVISPVQAIDGPSAQVISIEGAAMAEDGSGGIVYLKQVDGRNHVFAVQFRDGVWGAPQQVDVGQGFDSSWARIGAADGGELVVTWVQEFGVGTDRMFSATLDPGATGFQDPVPVDFDVGEATDTFPDLAMNSGGQAYLTYLVITDTSSLNPPGYLGMDVRVARYNNRLWSVIGFPVDRNPAIPMRAPTAATGPRIGIDTQGLGVVAWQEPGDDFVDRIWARRLFGTSVGVPLQVSPSTWDGAALDGAADAFSLDVSGFGQAAVAFRQQPGVGSRLTAPRELVSEMPDAFSAGANEFAGARLIDGGVQPGLGQPSVAVDPNGAFLSAFSAGTTSLLASGDNTTVGAPERLDQGGSSIAGDPQVDLSETGAAVTAWRELKGSTGSVGVQERPADGVVSPAELSAPKGGTIDPGQLILAGSGLGDAIVAWRQGSGAGAQIAAAVVDAPPSPFLLQAPEGWQRKPKLPVSWSAAPNGIGSVRYSLTVDDEQIGGETTKLHTLLASSRVGDGRHHIQVFAIDDHGQQTGSRSALLLVDRRAPRIRVSEQGAKLAVRVSDGRRRVTSGVKPSSVKISFGDGTSGATLSSAAHRIGTLKRHTYPGKGSYVLVVKARDRAGNRSVLRKRVVVR